MKQAIALRDKSSMFLLNGGICRVFYTLVLHCYNGNVVQEWFPATFSGILIVRHNCVCIVDGGVAILYHASLEVITRAQDGQHTVRLNLVVM